MSNVDPNKQLDRLLAEQSAALLETAGGERERRRLVDWLLQSKRHVRTHLFMMALEEELKHLDPQRRIPVPDVRARCSAPVASLTSASSGRGSGRRRWTWAAAAAVAIAVTAALTLAFVVGSPIRWQEYSTAVGEQRAVQLKDGSVIQLNTGSRVKTRLSAASREIRLLDGEALFKVHQDPTRPFNVYTPDATIVAVGTQFNVYRSGGSTKVSVLEGRVRVVAGNASSRSAASPSASTPLLAAGEEAQVRPDGRIDRRRTADVANSAAWVQRRVVFKQEPLEKVVTEFNRYRESPQFRVADPILAARKYSGTFDVDDPRSLEDVLANERDVVIERSDGAVFIRRRDK